VCTSLHVQGFSQLVNQAAQRLASAREAANAAADDDAVWQVSLAAAQQEELYAHLRALARQHAAASAWVAPQLGEAMVAWGTPARMREAVREALRYEGLL
jgi:hypothetical protein